MGSEKANNEKYGTSTPPEMKVEDIQVPIAFYSAIFDRIVSVYENRKWQHKMPSVFSSEELDGDHLSFLIGKDMSFMESVLSMMFERNPPDFESKIFKKLEEFETEDPTPEVNFKDLPSIDKSIDEEMKVLKKKRKIFERYNK